MKKIIIIASISTLSVVCLNLLQMVDIPSREIIYSAVSVLFLVLGCIILKIFEPSQKWRRFFKFKQLRMYDIFVVFWISLVIISGSFLLNFAEVYFWEYFEISRPENGISGMNFENVWMMLLTLAIIPAIFEELFFRGAALSALESHGKLFAVLISSFFFFVMHGSYYYFLSTLFAGIMFSILAYSVSSVFAAMLAHFVNNILSYVLYYYSDRLSVVGLDIFVIYGLIFVLLLGIYGTLSSMSRRLKIKNGEDVKIYNEGELVWERKKGKGRK